MKNLIFGLFKDNEKKSEAIAELKKEDPEFNFKIVKIEDNLLDLGLNKSVAEMYDQRIKEGDILVAVTADEDKAESVGHILTKHSANEITVVPKTK